ncbi:MAG: ABC transporter permease [Deferribacteraceae bacterium]|jgi:lipoprotein-releasing system permease protein|nr:ABC transporter permease [Deferribacteraceae bacterium]
MAKLENLFASRFMKARKSNSLLSFLSITSIVGVMIGVAALIVVISVMDGFTENLKLRFLGANPHITVASGNGRPILDWQELIVDIKAVPHVSQASPLIMGTAMISDANAVTGVFIRGIDPVNESAALKESVRIGSLDELRPASKATLPNVLVGKELMRKGMIPGNDITILSPNMTRSAFGLVPKMREYNVSGYFDAGMFQHNGILVYMELSEAQSFFGLGDSVSAINVSVDNPDNAPIIAREIQTMLNGRPSNNMLSAYDWLSLNTMLFESLKLEQYALFVILTLIIIVASFTIVSMITVTVKDKRKEIAIIRAMGGSKDLISKIFIRQGIIIGFVGTMLGNLFALAISFVLMNFKIIDVPAEIYYSETIPIKLSAPIFVIVTVCALLITFIAALFPAKMSAKMSPIEAIRND